MKHDKGIKNFLENEVDLNHARLQIAAEKLKIVKDVLKEKYGERLIDMKVQGSYATNTVIKPTDEGDEYDVDILVIIKVDDPFATPADVLGELEEFVKGDGRKLVRKKKCVRINYAGEFHLDVVPCVDRGNGRYEICNRIDKVFELSDGGKYADWFTNIDERHGGHLSESVRLLKWVRDHKKRWSVPSACPSIIITTLLGSIAEHMPGSNSISETFVLLLEGAATKMRVSSILQNPTLPNEDLFANRSEIVKGVRDGLEDLARKSRDALDEVDNEESIKKWRIIFGDDFGGSEEKSASSTDSSVAGAATIPVNTIVQGSEPKHWADNEGDKEDLSVEILEEDVDIASSHKYLSDRYGEENVRQDSGNLIIDPMRFTLNYIQEKERKTTILNCVYGIRIEYRSNVQVLPRVYEIHGKIPKKIDRHIYSNGSFCLDLPEVVYKKMGHEFNIQIFIESFVEPFLAWQEYYNLCGKALWETRIHGSRARILALMNKEISREDLFHSAVL